MVKISSGKFKRVNSALSVLCFIFFLCLLIIPQEYAMAGIVVTAVPAAAAFVIYLKQSREKYFAPDKQNFIISAVMAVLYEVMLSVTSLYGASFTPMSKYLAGKIGVSKQLLLAVITAGFCVMTFVSVFAVVYFCVSLLCRELPDSGENPQNTKLYVNLGKVRINKYLLPIFILTVVFAVSAFWGYDYPDTRTVYKDAINNTYNQWHTVGYEFFCKLCLMLFGYKLHLTPIIIVQAVLFIIIQNYVLNVIGDYFKSKKACLFYVVTACVIITPIYYVQFVIKDTMFSAFLFGFSAAIFNFVKTPKVKAKDYIALAFMGIGASLFRHFGVVVVAVSFVGLFIYQFFSNRERFKKTAVKIVASALVPIIAFTGISTVLGDKVLNAKQNPVHVTYILPIYLAVAVADAVGREGLDDETVKVLESKLPIESWCVCYEMDIYWADTVTRDWSYLRELVNTFDADFCHDVLKANFRLVLSHPKEYLTALFNITSIVWEISTPGPNGYIVVTGDDEEWEGKITRNTAFQGTWTSLKGTVDNPITVSVLWRGGLWVFIGVLSAAVLMKKRAYNSLMAFIPVFLYALSLMVSCPAQDPRYVISFLQVGIFVLVLARYEKATPKNGQKSTDIRRGDNLGDAK